MVGKTSTLAMVTFIANLSQFSNVGKPEPRLKRLHNRLTETRSIRQPFVRIVAAASVLQLAIYCTPSLSQGVEPPPELPMRDQIGVDLSSGKPVTTLTDLGIGVGSNSLTHTIATYDNHFGGHVYGFHDDYMLWFVASPPGNNWRVTVGHDSTTFNLSNGDYLPLGGDGSDLTDNGNGTYTFTSRDGDRAHFGNGVSFEKANGLKIQVHAYSPPGDHSRIQSVTTNTGLQLKYDYAINAFNPNDPAERLDFYRPTRITAINNAYEYCNPTAHSCNLSQAWPNVNYTWPSYIELYGDPNDPNSEGSTNTFQVTDAGGRITKYKQDPQPIDVNRTGPLHEQRITEISQSTSNGPVTSSFVYDHYISCVPGSGCTIIYSNVVAQASRGTATWNYSYPVSNTPYVVGTNTSTGPEGSISVTMDNYGTVGGPSLLTHFDGTVLTFSQDDLRRLESADYPSGNEATFEYDDRGNLKKRTDSGNGAVTEAGFDPCNSTNFRWCNKPRWTEDAYDHRTEYEYGDEHGMVTRVTLPAPSAGAPRPETRYFYQQYFAWYKNSSGNVVQSTSPIWLLQKESTCVIGAASGNGCANSNYELTIEYEYGQGSPSKANNLWLRGKTVKGFTDNFTTLEIQRTCYEYDAIGNTIAVTRPAANLSSCD